MKDDKPPKGGWLGPPPTKGLAPIATAVSSKGGKWKWKSTQLTGKQLKRHNQFQAAMSKADRKGEWGFTWK